MSLIKVNQLSTLDAAVDREISANTGLKIPLGEDFKVEGRFLDGNVQPGTSGQYLVSTGTGVEWETLPNDLGSGTDANVTFASLTVTNLTVAPGGTANFNLSNFTTDDLAEGGALYFTTARARESLDATISGSGDGGLSYNEGSGVFTYTGPNALDYRAAFSVEKYDDGVETYLGNLTYDNIQGKHTYLVLQ